MKKTNLIITLLIVCLTFLIGKEVPLKTAELVAKNVLIERGYFNPNDISISSFEVVNSGSTELFYIFSASPEGFAIIAADDRIEPVLGYGFQGNLNVTNLPPQLEMLLDGYREQIEYVLDNDLSAEQAVQSNWEQYTDPNFSPDRDFRDVNPMMSAHWGQGGGWNQYCPSGTLVGCVAVSMGQIMYHWEFPETGVGYNIYFEDDFGEINVNFGNANYNYDSMYDNIASSEAAELLYHCGVAVNMDYGWDGSGAQVGGDSEPNAYTALRDNFLFDTDSLSHQYRGNMSDSDWQDIILHEMDSNRPIIYAGHDASAGVGHAWNVDGYQGGDNPYFHCNWGWDGYADGYFSLNDMSPAGSNFSIWHQVIYGIQPGSLEVPNLVITETVIQEVSGDMDGVVNPGETVELFISFENLFPWGDAISLDLILMSENSDIVIENDFLYTTDIIPSGSIYDFDEPFILNINEGIITGEYNLELMAIAIGADGMSMFENSFNIPLNVSLNQAGFPISEIGQVGSSPAVYDLDEDGTVEIIFAGFSSGDIHIVDPVSNELPGYPINIGSQRIEGAPAIVDLDNDGTVEIVFAGYTTSPTQGYIIILHPETMVVEEITTGMDGHKLYGTPAIGNLDDDPELEIVVGSYATGGTIFSLNCDGTHVSGFPVVIDEKITSGVALADFDGNGKDDVVFGTMDENLYLLYDDTSIADGFPFTVEHDFREAPAIVKYNDEMFIFAGNRDDNFYAVDGAGSEIFHIETDGDIFSTPAFCKYDNTVAIFWGSWDGYLYGVDLDGNDLPGYPIDIGGDTDFAPVIADLDNDEIPEVVIPTNDWYLHAYDVFGNTFTGFPVYTGISISSSPTIHDIDMDGDLEIITGSSDGLTCIDVKQSGYNENYWNVFRGNLHRNGFFDPSSADDDILLGDVNEDTVIDVLDVVIVVNAIMQGITDDILTIADMNEDGIIDVLDIVQIVNIIMS